MSWHWLGPVRRRGPRAGPPPPVIRAIMSGRAARSVALSAPVGVPVPFRAFTTLSSRCWAKLSGSAISCSPILTMNAPRARAASIAACRRAASAGASPCVGAGARSLKIRGEDTMAARSGCASGTLITSIRNSALFGSSSGYSREQPGSSVGDRTPAEPEMYTYTLSLSFASTSTEWVWEPRQVWTLPTFFGFLMSVMSKMRSPRSRSLLTVSATPCAPQSIRPESPSPETNSRCL